MAESIPNSKNEKQDELQKEAQEKERLANFEKWDSHKQELLDRNKEYWQKEEQSRYKHIIDQANGLHLRPNGMKPDAIVDKAGYEKAAKDAKAYIAVKQFEWLKIEQRKFFKALEKDRDKPATLDLDKDTGKMQDKGKASPQPFNQPQQNRSRSRFDALRVTEQQVITKNQENANDRGERLRSVLAQQQQKKNRDHER